MAAKRTYSATEEKGLTAVRTAVDEFGWIHRDYRVGDFGIDLKVETTTATGEPTSREIAVQVKAGVSYFDGRTTKTYVRFHTDQAHVDYWNAHSAPVALVLFNPDTKQLIWQWTKEAKPTKGGGWRIDVPLSQTLDLSAKDAWAAAAIIGNPITSERAQELGDKVARSASDQERKPTVVLGPDLDDTGRAFAPTGPVAYDNDDPGFSAKMLAQLEAALARQIEPLRAVADEPDGAGKSARDREDQALHGKIDAFRETKNSGAPHVAFTQLVNLLEGIDRARNPHAAFRAITNIGAAALDLGEYDEAAERFEAAYELEPETPLAIANLALAKLFRHDFKAAFDTAGQALEIDPASNHAIAIRLQAAARIGWEGDPQTLVPAELETSTDTLLGLAEFYRIKGDPSWAAYAIDLAEKHPDERIFKRLSAYAILDLAGADRRKATKSPSGIASGDILKAAESLKSEVERVLAFDRFNREEVANEAANVAVAYRLVDDLPSAIAFLRRVLDRLGEWPALLRVLGIVEIFGGEGVAGRARLAQLVDDGEAQLVLAEFEGNDDPKAALARVLAIPAASVPKEHDATRWLVAADLASMAGDDAALDIALSELEARPKVAPAAALHRAQRTFKRSGDEDQFRAELADLAQSLSDDTEFVVRLSVAAALRSADLVLEGSRLLDGWVDLSKRTTGARLYLQLLAESGRDKDFLQAIENVPEELRGTPQLLWMRAAHAFNSGDLAGGEKLARQLLAQKPRDASALLLVAEALARRRDQIALKKILETDLETLENVSIDERLRIARILFHNGQYSRALAYCYRLVLENRDVERVWMTFASLVLETGRRSGPRLSIRTVRENATVELKFEDGTSELLTVETDDDLLRLDDEAREPEHPDIVSIWDKKAGDDFALPNGRVGVVGEIRHKFVARMQRILAHYERRFPTGGGFKSYSIDPDKAGSLDEILAVMKERREYVEREASAYAAGDLLLTVFAYRIGVDTIDAAAGLHQSGQQFRVAIGSEEEREKASRDLRANGQKGFVVDVQSFWTLWKLGALAAFEAGFGKLHYSLHTLDVLHARAERMAGELKQGHKSMTYHEGKLLLDEVAPERIAAAKEDVDAAIRWLTEHGVQTPIYLPNDAPDELIRTINDLKLSIFDEVLIAKDKDLLLLVDDAFLRRASQIFPGIRTSWLNWAMAALTETGTIDLGRYAEWTGHLLEAGQTYIGVSAPVLIAALEADLAARKTRPGETFISLSKSIGGAHADLESHLRVVAQTIYFLWKAARFMPLRAAATGHLLDRAIAERQRDYQTVLTLLMRVFRREPFILEYIRGWIGGHFLAPRDE